MSNSHGARAQQLDDEEQLMSCGTSYSVKGFGFQPSSGLSSIPGCLGQGHIPLVLRLLSFTLFAVLLVAVLIKVSEIPSSQGQKQESEIYKELTELKAGVDRLCRPCPWEWMFFQRNCYFFSKSQRNWNDSVTACQEVGAQLVIIQSDEEQSFLQLTSKSKGYAWMGLTDLNKEATWHWVDGSPLLHRFAKYWNDGEPNNTGEEDCVEFRGDGWNDTKCRNKKFWICKKSAASCSTK